MEDIYQRIAIDILNENPDLSPRELSKMIADAVAKKHESLQKHNEERDLDIIQRNVASVIIAVSILIWYLQK